MFKSIQEKKSLEDVHGKYIFFASSKVEGMERLIDISLIRTFVVKTLWNLWLRSATVFTLKLDK